MVKEAKINEDFANFIVVPKKKTTIKNHVVVAKALHFLRCSNFVYFHAEDYYCSTEL
jgi:hypothetical protein